MSVNPDETVPIIILGGSDRKPGTLPDAVTDKHPLTGYKGSDLHVDGRPLIRLIVERLVACGAFAPIHVVGPATAYAGVLPAEAQLIDANGTFGENIRISMERVRRAHPGRPVAFTTCDILPEVDTLRAVMDDYARHAPCDLWFPLIRVPADRSRLGASAWKPSYRIPPAPGQPPAEVLPSHLLIADPAALRLAFVYHLFQLGYRTRNRPIAYRRAVMVRGVLAGLLYQDLRHALVLRMPNLTWTVLGSGLPTARRLKEGRASRSELERTVRRIFCTHRHCRRHPERGVRLPIVDGLSLALDVDTEEEARQLGAEITRHNAGG